MMSQALEIDIAVCTFRRPHIEQTLRSVAGMKIPPEWQLRLIVADNDETPSAKSLVERTACEIGLNVSYVHAPARNISIARNACLDAAAAPLLAFIDDDEEVTVLWLEALLDALERTGADAVLGPVRATYPEDCPSWAREADFHSTSPVFVDDRIITGYTCNVLFRREAAPFKGLRFREALGRSGGEDTVFFSDAYANGAKIVYAPFAIVTEFVSPERLQFRWLLRRRFRAGQTHGMLIKEKRGGGNILPDIIKASGKALFCFAAAVFSLFSMKHTRLWILRGTLHAGVVSRLLGKRESEHYG